MKQNLGPDALQIDFETYLKRLQRKKGAVKCVLMDQSVLSGIGNLYADEILFHARIHPRQPVAIMESMKMESTLYASKAGRVSEIRCEPGQILDMGQIVLVIS